jgi:3-hydroxyisobutyrate dehydrogenase
VEAVADPLLAALDEDAVWWQASTIGVEAIERLAVRTTQFVDAPVLGTKQPAEQGNLIVLAAGRLRDRCGPAFEPVAARVVDLGDEIGAGTRMKLVVNTWLLALTEGLAESVLLAEGLGVDPATFLDVIDGGPMGPPYAKLKGTAMIERSFAAAFPLKHAAKDAGLVLDAATEAGMELPLLEAVRSQMQRSIELGHGDEDLSATVEATRDAS